MFYQRILGFLFFVLDQIKEKIFLRKNFLFLSIVIAFSTSWFLPKVFFVYAHIISDLMMKFFKLISLPVICFSLLSTISGMRSWHKVKSMTQKIALLTVFTTILSASVAFVLYIIFNPAHSAFVVESSSNLIAYKESYLSQLMNIIPSNIFQPFIENNVIGGVLISLLFGFALLFIPEDKRLPVSQLLNGMFLAVMKIIQWLVSLMPIAIWAFITILIEDCQKGLPLSKLFYYLTVVVGANLVQAIVILPAILKINKVPVLKTFKAMFPALSFAFFTKSSPSTIPIAIDCAEKLGVRSAVARFSFPLCTTINMNGCAAFIFTTVLFVSESNGVQFSLFEQISWIFIATIAAIGNAGVPMGCFFLSSALLSTMEVPIALMGLILPFYSIIDMLETSINIWSDSCVTVLVNRDQNI